MKKRPLVKIQTGRGVWQPMGSSQFIPSKDDHLKGKEEDPSAKFNTDPRSIIRIKVLPKNETVTSIGYDGFWLKDAITLEKFISVPGLSVRITT